jgi:streptomycin 6-kinase
LHGDFHPANIVSATREPFLVIDPKGIAGPVGYEIAVFLNNYHWWQETRADIRIRLDSAVRQFSAAFDIEPTELRQWAFAQMVLGAWWTFDEMPEIYQNEVVKADVWDI